MAIRQARFQRLAWIMACGLTLVALVLGFCLLPEWEMATPGPQPVAPRITLAGTGKMDVSVARELRMVRSPTLIALAQGLTLPGGARKPGPEISPPAGPPRELPDGLGMPILARDLTLAMEGGSVLRRQDITGVGVFSSILKFPDLPKEPVAEFRAVTLDYSGGLAGKHIDVAGWTWERWTQTGDPWVLSLDIQSDSQGRITQVLLDASAVDSALGEALIQNLYQSGQVQPAGPCRGRVRISFSGAR